MDLFDTSRQWPTCYGQISAHHGHRYMFAAERADGRILDAACGVGYGTALLSARGPAVGVDISPEAIEWAEEHFHGPKYIVGNIENSPWGQGKFDTVVSFETIEHLEDPYRTIKAFRRACLGVFMVSVPNEEKYPFKPEDFANDESPHFRHYTPAEFDQLLKDHGFEVVKRYCQVNKTEPKVVAGTDGRFLVYVCR